MAAGVMLSRTDRMILLLALAGAGVDAVVILGFNVLTAAQTGNTILLAVALAEGRLAVGFSAAVSVIGYVIGAALGELLIERQVRAHAHGLGITRPLLAEGLFLSGVVVLWGVSGASPPQGTVVGLVLLAALAMGMQSTAVLRLHAGSTTTYITGMLTTFTAGLIRRLVVTGAPVSAGDQGGIRSDPTWRYGLTWVVYTAGAVACGLLFLRINALALLVPIVAIVAVAGLSLSPQPVTPSSPTTPGPHDPRTS